MFFRNLFKKIYKYIGNVFYRNNKNNKDNKNTSNDLDFTIIEDYKPVLKNINI